MPHRVIHIENVENVHLSTPLSLKSHLILSTKRELEVMKRKMNGKQ